MHAVGENLSGNEMYVKNLGKHLFRQAPPDMRFHLAFGHEKDLRHFEAYSGTRRKEDFDYTLLHTNSSLRRLSWSFPRLMSRERFDIAHFQYVLPFFGLGATRFVSVVHDMSFRRFPSHYTRKQHVIHRFIDRSSRRADRILTVSDFSKAEILHFYPFLRESDVTVTHDASDPEVFKKIADPRSRLEALESKIDKKIPDEFVLTVGNLQPRKNLERLLLAFDRVSDRRDDIRLVITGRRAWRYDDILRKMECRSRDRIVFTDYVDEDELVALYNLCRLFVYPSLYEGFGLPVVEAISCGAIALTSRGSSLEEVCPVPDALFDPLRPEIIAEKILDVLDDPDRYRRIQAQQTGLPDRFSWMDTAAKTIEIYRSLIQPAPGRGGPH
jgi:glycosyltransferase involved in cell wall biosynthesis